MQKPDAPGVLPFQSAFLRAPALAKWRAVNEQNPRLRRRS